MLVGGGVPPLALAPDVAGYGLDVLPGFVVLGFGVGADNVKSRRPRPGQTFSAGRIPKEEIRCRN
jgi:hypothetical protein